MNLKIENLSVVSTKVKDREILKDVNMEVKGGEWFGLVGETGSGKTTLLRAILRVLPESMSFKKGKILFNGRDLLKIKEENMRKIRGKEIFFVLQEPHNFFDPSMIISKQIEEFALCHGVESKDIKEKIYDFLCFAGFEEPSKWVKMYPFQLSSGMLQRIAISMAFLLEPKLILADEPTSSLDRVNEKLIVNLFLNSKNLKKVGLLFVTHRIFLLKDLTERMAVIYKGNLIEVGETKGIFSEPFHPYTSTLLGKISFKAHSFVFHESQYSCPFYPHCQQKTLKCEEEPPYFEKNGRMVKCWIYE